MSDEARRLYERLLVLRSQTGDAQAFRELVDACDRRLRYYLRKLVARPDRVDDLVQEVWIDVFRQLPRLQDAGAFTTWLYRIARGQAALHVRRSGKESQFVDGAQLAETAALEEEPDFAPEDARRIHAALDRLPPEQREVILLRFLEDLSYEEIGQVVGVPPGTVRSRIHYAKRTLRQWLDTER